MTLCGVGRSTAAAIAAFAFARRAAILDGNVKRVLTRCYGIEGWPGDKPSKTSYGRWPSSSCRTRWHMAAYTQGLMDLGSLLCVRGQPRCGECPMADGCVRARRPPARAAHRPPRKAQPLRSTVMLLARNAAGEVWLQRRPDSGVWGGLWSLPELADIGEAPLWLAAAGWTAAPLTPPWPTVQHVFTHFRLDITPQPVQVRATAGRAQSMGAGGRRGRAGAGLAGAGAPLAGHPAGQFVVRWRWRVWPGADKKSSGLLKPWRAAAVHTISTRKR